MKHIQLTSRTWLGLALMGALTAAPTLTHRAQAQTAPEPRTVGADDEPTADATDRPNAERRRRPRKSGPRADRDDRDREARRGPGPRARRDRRGESFADLDSGPRDRDNAGPRANRDFGGRDARDDGGRGRGPRGGRDFDARNRRDFGGRDGRDFGPRNRDNARPRDRRDFGPRTRPDGDFGGRARGGRFDERAPIAPDFVGVVTRVKNDREFDVRIADKIYNVYLSAPSAPVGVGQGVAINGERIGNNDIRGASLLTNRPR